MTTLSELQTALHQSYQQFIDLTDPLSDAAFSNRPATDKWSIGEHMHHLILASKGIASALARPKAFFAQYGEVQHIPRAFQDFQLQRGRSSPSSLIPDAAHPWSRQQVMDSWQMVQQKMTSRLPAHWTETTLDQYQLPHPLFGHLTIREMLYFVIAHNRLHRQAIAELNIEN